MSPRVHPKIGVDDLAFHLSRRLTDLELREIRRERLELLRGERADADHAEFRSRAAKGDLLAPPRPTRSFWARITASIGLSTGFLSKASSAAGGYLVPTSFDEQITAARRARAIIGVVSRELVTSDGSNLLVPTTTSRGTASWAAENAAYTASIRDVRAGLCWCVQGHDEGDRL
jgi:HK97 family phage major capsid protein